MPLAEMFNYVVLSQDVNGIKVTTYSRLFWKSRWIPSLGSARTAPDDLGHWYRHTRTIDNNQRPWWYIPIIALCCKLI